MAKLIFHNNSPIKDNTIKLKSTYAAGLKHKKYRNVSAIINIIQTIIIIILLLHKF